jgi:hypothetical protein
MSVVKMCSSAGIQEDELRGCVEPVVSRTDQNVISPMRLIKLPRGLEQFEELADHFMIG